MLSLREEPHDQTEQLALIDVSLSRGTTGVVFRSQASHVTDTYLDQVQTSPPAECDESINGNHEQNNPVRRLMSTYHENGLSLGSRMSIETEKVARNSGRPTALS